MDNFATSLDFYFIFSHIVVLQNFRWDIPITEKFRGRCPPPQLPSVVLYTHTVNGVYKFDNNFAKQTVHGIYNVNIAIVNSVIISPNKQNLKKYFVHKILKVYYLLMH